MLKQQPGANDINLSVREKISSYTASDAQPEAEYMRALNELGKIRTQLGDVEAAAKYHEEALDYFRQRKMQD